MSKAPQSTPTPDRAEHRWELVTARDLMRTDLVTVSYAAPLSEVEAKLGEHGFSGAPVVDAENQLISA